jgi:branched-chain amino acid transport system substrate-binding protein
MRRSVAKPMRRSALTLGAIATVAVVVAGCGSSGSGSGSSSAGSGTTAPGVTASTVTVGVIADLTGPLASSYPDVVQAFKARIDLQNAQGGVDGRKILVQVADGQSSATGDLSAAQDLVVSKHVFALGSTSLLASTSAHYLNQQGVPVTGLGFDGGPEWAQNSNMFDGDGDIAVPFNAGQYDTTQLLFKQLGISKVGAVGYGDQSGSAANTAAFIQGAKRIGLNPVFTNTSSTVATGLNTDAVVLGIKQSGVEGIESAMGEADTVKLLEGVKQAGLTHVVIASSLYGQPFLADSAAIASAQGSYVWAFQTPLELHTPAVNQEATAIAKYAGIHGDLDISATDGWVSADLLIAGLKAAGKNLTREGFIKALDGVHNYNASGILPATVDFSKKTQNMQDFCFYFLKVQGDAFIPQSGAVCGTPPSS